MSPRIRASHRLRKLGLALATGAVLLGASSDTNLRIFLPEHTLGAGTASVHDVWVTVKPGGDGKFHSMEGGYAGTTDEGTLVPVAAPLVDAARSENKRVENTKTLASTGEVKPPCPEVRSSDLEAPLAPKPNQPATAQPPAAATAGDAPPKPPAAGNNPGSVPGTAGGGGAISDGSITAGSSNATRVPASTGSFTLPTQGSDREPLQDAGPVTSAADISSNASQILPQIREATNEVQGNELVKGATRAHEQLQQEAYSDYNKLRAGAKAEIESQARFTQTPLDAAENVLKNAQTNLQDYVNVVEQGKGGLPDGNKNAILLPLENARDKVALALSDIGQEKLTQDPLGNLPSNPFRGLGSLGPVTSNPFAVSPALRSIFESEAITSKNANTPDALVDRTIFLSGLTPESRRNMLTGLNLIETPTLKLNNGTERKIPVLHNGYIFGGSKTGLDCSSFISRLLPASLRQFRFTTLDFWAIWHMKKQGTLPRPPSYPPAHAELLSKAATAFNAIDIYAKETLTTGDLLVYRLPWDPAGHVFLVKSYNPRKQTLEVIEAAQSAGTIREREFPLTINPQSKILRPGLLGLRIKPVDNAVCSYKNPGNDRRTASQLEKGGAQ